MPDSFDDRFSGLPVDAPSTPLISDIVGNAQIASPQFNLVPVDYDPFPKRQKGPAAWNDEPPSEMIRPEAPVADKMFGLNGKERYQFFPERLARSVYDIMSGQVAPYNPSTGEYNVEGAMDVAGLLGGAPLGIKPGAASVASGATRKMANELKMTPIEHNPFDKNEYPLEQSLKDFAKKWDDNGVRNYVAQQSEGAGGNIKLHDLVVPKENRGQGIGSQFLNELTKIADESQKTIVLTAAKDYGASSLDRLKDFYKQFGFVENKGRNKDFRISDNMYRKPNTTLLSDTQKPGLAIAELKEPAKPFFSAVEKAVTDISQPKMTGQQWLGTLSNKPGVKPEELDWIGLKDYLKENADKVVTKQEIESHVAANKVELKDVDKGFGPSDKKRLVELDDKLKQDGKLEGNEIKEYNDLIERENFRKTSSSFGTKYESYQLPGGENYREKLLTLPSKSKLIVEKYGSYTEAMEKGTIEEKKYLEESLGKNYQNENTYKSSHWDEPNVLAHVRMNDRTIEGKKSLHIEEIQSDWHQQGRQQGYKEANLNPGNYGDFARSKGYTNEQVQSTFHDFKDPIYREWQDKQDAYEKNISAVPDAPFKKTWHELALKRMLREAAEKGYDRLSWTPGEAQAARYDLSKQIQQISFHTDEPGKGTLLAYDHKGETVLNKQVTNAEKELPDIIGKEATKKLLEQKPKEKLGSTRKEQSLTGLELKVGGEGMKGFYDQIIPKALEKIGKEHGVKVKQLKTKAPEFGVFQRVNQISKDFPTAAEAREWAKANGYEGNATVRETNPGNPHEVHYIDIPQSLKDQAMHKGFPLFSGGFMLNPVDHDPFSKEKK